MTITEVPPGLTIEELLALVKGQPVQTRIQFPKTDETVRSPAPR